MLTLGVSGLVNTIDQPESIVQAIAELAAVTGMPFFQALVHRLIAALGADRVALCQLPPNQPGQMVVRAEAPAGTGNSDDSGIPLPGTHEATLLRSGIVVHTATANREHWSGVSLIACSGRPVGILSVVFRQAPANLKDVECALACFAPRAAAEIEREENERQQRELIGCLQQMVDDRTAQLAAANQELEAFSYSVSHDLRAAIQGILACSRIVVQDHGDKLDETGKMWLGHLAQDAAQLDRLTMALLDLSLVSRAQFSRGDVDLSGLAEETCRRLAAAEPERKAVFRIAPGLQTSGDASLLRTVFDHLLGNAWKFTGKTAEAEIEFGAVDQAGQSVYFVRDNGVGFNMKYAQKLFGAFQRLHRPEDFEGNGIGLATVRRVVHRHGGRVWAEARTGAGATFFFTLGTSATP